MKNIILLFLTFILFSGCSYIDSLDRYYTYKYNKDNGKVNNLCVISDECNMIFGTFKAKSVSDYVLLIYKKNSNSMFFLTATKLFHTKDHSYLFVISLPAGNYAYDIVKTNENTSSVLLINPKKNNFNISRKIDDRYNKNIITLDPFIASSSSVSSKRQKNIESIFIDNNIISKLKKKNNFYEKKKYPLDSSIFSDKLIKDGMYNISKFDRQTTYMYSIGKASSKKIPVIFVHGVLASPNNFIELIDSIDKTKFIPYVIFYPTGESLTLNANILSYMIFSSGIIQDTPSIVIGYSMGGLISKEALNQKDMYNIKSSHLFISIASPFGGIELAKNAHKAPYVIPLWRDIAPKSDFIKNLFLKNMKNTKHHMFFAFKEKNIINKILPNNDGTVSISSQLKYMSQDNAVAIYGLNETHTSILKSSKMINKINTLIEKFYEEQVIKTKK